MDGLGQTSVGKSGDHEENGVVNGHSASWATQKWSSAGAALEPSPDSLPTFGDRRGIDALTGAKPPAGTANAAESLDVPPHFVPFGMIEDPYADELAQRSAEFARHAAFDDPTPPQGLPVWNPSPPLVPAPASASPEPATPEHEVTVENDPPLAAQLSLGQRFELAFAERDLEPDRMGGVRGAANDRDADLDVPDLEVDPLDSTLEITNDLTSAYGPRFESLPPVALPIERPMSPPAPMSAPPSQFHPQAVADPAPLADAMDPVSPAAGPQSWPRPTPVQDSYDLPGWGSEAQSASSPWPVGEQQSQAHLGPVADPQAGPHVRPMADSQGRPHLGPVADAQGGARLGPVPEPWAPAFGGSVTDPSGGPRAGQADLLGRRRLTPVAGLDADTPGSLGATTSATSEEDTGLGPVPGDELPQRVPSHPDVPATVEPADSAHQPPDPLMGRVLEGLKKDDAPPTERPVGFDTEAVLEAVRSVTGVRQATIRTTVTGGHHLRLELAEGADPSAISSFVARMLQEQMGLDAALTGPPPGRPVDPGPTGLESPGRPGDGPQVPPRIPGQHDPGGQAGQPPFNLPGPRVGAGATPPSTFDDVPPSREPRRRHPVSVPRRQPNDLRPPAEFRSPTDFRSATDFRPPGVARPPVDPRSPGETRPPSDIRFGEPRPPSDTRSPADIRFGGDARQPERTPPTWRAKSETEYPAPGLPPAVPTDRDQGPRAVIEHVQTSTYGLDATVEVRLTTDGREARGFASGPAVDGYVLRLCAAATAKAVDELLKNGTTTGEAGRCFVEHAAIVPMGSCDVAVVVVLLVCGGWVEQLAGSALVSGDPRRAVVRATLGAVNRRLAALLP